MTDLTMTEPTWIRKVGDTSPALEVQLRDPPTVDNPAGAVPDLTGATSILGIVRRRSDKGLVNEDAAGVVGTPTNARVAIVLTPTISSQSGMYDAEIVVTWPDRQASYPAYPAFAYYTLLVQPDLASVSVPVAPVPPGPGGTQPGGATDSGMFTADVDLSAFRAVTRTDTGVAGYDPTLPDPGVFYGVTSSAANAGGTINVVTDGPFLVGSSTLTPAATYYAVGAGGALSAVAPTSGLLVPVGSAVDANTFNVSPGQIIDLA